MDALISGKLAYIFAVSVLDAAFLSWIAVRWYRRRVHALMRQASDAAPPAPRPGAHATTGTVTDVTVAPRASSFRPAGEPDRAATTAATDQGAPAVVPRRLRAAVHTLAPASGRQPPDGSPGRHAGPRVLTAYVTGALMQAVFFAVIILSDEGMLRIPATYASMIWREAWPLVPTLILVLVYDRRLAVRAWAAYLGGGVAAVAIVTLVVQLMRGAPDMAIVTNPFWASVSLIYSAWVPLLLAAFVMWRRVRAVIPLVLTSTLVFGFAAVAFRDVVVAAFDVPALRSTLLDMAVLSNVNVVYYALFLLASLPVGLLVWAGLGRLASAYEAKWFSDTQLTADCLWLVVIAERTATLSVSLGATALAVGAAGFVLYRGTVWITLRLWPAALPPVPSRLLLLRVFGHDARTETLFDRVAQRWRFLGPVQLIGGTDLAGRTLDPGDMLSFLGGRLDERYVSKLEAAAQRVSLLDLAPDPDGRYRVNDVYCRDHTWQAAIGLLIDASDAVVMDVRSLSSANRGCVFELEQLLLRLPPDRVVLIVDHTTDLDLLRAVLEDAWATAVRAGRARDGDIGVARVERHAPAELDLVVRKLRGESGTPTVVPLSELPVAFAR
ncbi:MAG: hypothetical protein AB7G23_11605 [Vicinamibacterales bacterium]